MFMGTMKRRGITASDCDVTQPRMPRARVGPSPSVQPSAVYRELVGCVRAFAPDMLPWLADRMTALDYAQATFSLEQLAQLVAELERAIPQRARPGAAAVAIIGLRQLVTRLRR
jgi:hypothetical protein